MLQLENYEEHERHLPAVGKFVIAQFDKESIIVYQAFNDAIAEYAVAHQRFGGEAYDFERMTWLKPSFLWMMYYSGWAKKENQENVLAIRISRKGFDEILRQSVLATWNKEVYTSKKNWEKELGDADVKLQWEPYQDLFGNKTDRKAVKIGIAAGVMQRYNEEWILDIENITDYVREQQQRLKSGKVGDILLPRERAYAPGDLTILTKIDATTISL